MAYGGFPYTPYYTPVQAQQYPVNTQSGLIWVQGEAGAKSYLVAPNNTVPLWDSEAQVIYLKSADAAGMPTMKVLDYTIREYDKNGPISPSLMTNGKLPDYATKGELRAIESRINDICKRIDEIPKQRKVTDDE